MRWRMAAVTVFLVMAVAFALQSCGGKRSSLLVDHPGYSVYRKYCRRCHGDEGDAARASRMAHRHIDLASSAFHDTTTVDEVLSVVSDGKGRMKGYRDRVDPPELDNVTAYVLALAEARRAARNP